MCLFVSVLVRVCVCLPACMFVCLCCSPVRSFDWLCVCLRVCISLFACVFVCLPVGVLVSWFAWLCV